MTVVVNFLRRNSIANLATTVPDHVQAMEITKRNCIVCEKQRDFPITYPINVIFEAETGCIKAEVDGGNSKHDGVNTAVVAVEIKEERGVEEVGPAVAPEGEREREHEKEWQKRSERGEREDLEGDKHGRERERN